MKLTSINGASLNFDLGLNSINTIIYEILAELGVTVSEIKLSRAGIPYYEGVKSPEAEHIVSEIRSSNGLIFGLTAMLGSPSALLQTFMEHMCYPEFRDALSKKNCLILMVSDTAGQRQAMDQLSRFINSLGGFDPVKICVSDKHLKDRELDSSAREIIEKQVEDFYRIVGQNRKYLIPDADALVISQPSAPSEKSAVLSPEEQSRLQTIEQKKKIPIANIYEDLGGLSKLQEQDINEITQFFATKYSEKQNKSEPEISYEPTPIKPEHITPRVRTVKQCTASLPHYFNPQFSSGLNACIQFSISGAEKFEGYLVINNTECQYSDGQAENPDITIISDDAVWMGVLKGKYTAQKSFMIGQLKVRGNFVLLSKFDQLFKPVQ